MFSTFGLPLLPGFSFNVNVGQTRFHKSQHFETLNDMPTITEKKKPGIGGVPLPGTINTPQRLFSTCPRSEYSFPRNKGSDLPAWIVFDKKVLCFDCYFQETVPEAKRYSCRTHKCKIFFFLEDETVQVTEPKIPNSGIAQGTLISRQRIRLPEPKNEEFYNILHFNLGREIELYGRVFKITDCDRFTRCFLNRCGIAVPDPLIMPEDMSFIQRGRENIENPPQKHYNNKFGKFLQHDRQVLSFGAYWDDRNTEGGFFHELNLYYYLADDTIEIKNLIAPNSGQDTGLMFLSRGKLPKEYKSVPSPGWESPYTILNVYSSGSMKGRLVTDPLNCAEDQENGFYKERDLAIGGCINVYGRKVVLTDCDEFTKEFYRTKYGLNDFTSEEQPNRDYSYKLNKTSQIEPLTQDKDMPNKDSEFICPSSNPNQNLIYKDSLILRFKAEMVSDLSNNYLREFIISYHLSDDTIVVHELARQNTGFRGGCFFSKGHISTSGPEADLSSSTKQYKISDLFIGNIVPINGFRFRLIDADEYTLRFMEANCHRFLMSNPVLILKKVREALKPKYKEFVAEHFLIEPGQSLPVENFRYALRKLLGNDTNEHEIITLCRFYNANKESNHFSREQLRSIVHTELKRFLFDDFERLEENFVHKDPLRSGYLKQSQVYSSLRGVNLPIDKDLTNTLLEQICTNSIGHINYTDLLQFLNYKKSSAPCSVPINIKKDFSFTAAREVNSVHMINIQTVLKDLDLEASLVTQSS